MTDEKTPTTPLQRVQGKLGKLLEQLGAVHTEIGTWTNASEGLREATAKALEAVAALENMAGYLPSSWVPEKAKPKAKGLQPGNTASVLAKVMPQYEGILADGDMEGLQVLELRAKGKVLCKTETGEKIILPRAHLMPDDGHVTPEDREES